MKHFFDGFVTFLMYALLFLVALGLIFLLVNFIR